MIKVVKFLGIFYNIRRRRLQVLRIFTSILIIFHLRAVQRGQLVDHGLRGGAAVCPHDLPLRVAQPGRVQHEGRYLDA